MKKIFLVVAILLCTLLLCTSCGKEMSYTEYYENVPFKSTYSSITQAQSIGVDSSSSYYESSENLMVFSDSTTYKVYNLNTGTQIFSTDKQNCSISFNNVYGVKLFTVRRTADDGSVTTTVYNDKGSQVASANTSASISSSMDLFSFAGTIYRISSNGTAKEVCNGAFFQLPSFDYKTENYYYLINSYEVSVYDKDLNLTYYWEAPHREYGEIGINVLSEETILVQLMEILPEDAKKYDLLMDGEKYGFKSLILDTAKGKEKEVKLDYVVFNVSYFAGKSYSFNQDAPVYNEDIKALAILYYVEDTRVLTSDRELVSLNPKTGKIDKVIASEYESFERLTENRYLLTYNNGESIIVDEEGELVANAGNNFNSAIQYRNKNYLYSNGKIYNYDLKVKLDLDAEGLTFVKMMPSSVICKNKNNDFFLFTAKGERKSIDKYYAAYDGYYVTRRDTLTSGVYEFTIYNDLGESITTKTARSFNQTFSYTVKGVTNYVVCFTDSEYRTTYYILK